LTHVTDGETTKRGEISECLDAKGLGGLHEGNASISSLDKLGVLLQNLSGTTVHLLDDIGEFAGNVSSVAIQHWGVSVGDLSRVVHDDNLGLEASGRRGGVGLGVGSDESTSEILDGNVLDVETNIVTGAGLSEGLVMHLDGLDFGDNHGGGEHGMDTRLDNSGLNTTDGNRSNSSNLVNILKRKAEGLVGGTLGWGDSVKSLEEVGSLVPRHVA
jgi:hypothetical protein